MNRIVTKQKPSDDSQKVLESLRLAVDKALERKRKLGQYYVTWHDGKVVVQGEDAPAELTKNL